MVTPVGGPGDAVRVAVLDVESAMSKMALALIPNRGGATIDRAMLHEVTAAAVLSFDMGDGGLARIVLDGVLSDDDGEPAVLGLVEARLAALGDGGVLVTHNGIAHDIPLCLRRCLANWMFGASAIEAWAREGETRHVDTLRRCGGRGPVGASLVDLCASLGIAAAVPPPDRARPVDARIRKGAVDVISTALVFLHLEAMRRGDARWLGTCWRDLSAHLMTQAVRSAHLDPLARQGLAVARSLGTDW